MTIFLNNEPVSLPNDYMTVEDLLVFRGIKPQGTAVAINDKLLRKEQWKLTKLENLMQLTIITAAFGG